MTTAVAIPFMDLKRQHEPMAGAIDQAIDRVIGGCGFTLGDEVEEFEREFARFCGTKHAVGVGSGTDALHFALRACGVGPGDEVITAVNTFAATAEAILMAGATPVFVDIDENTYLVDVSKIEAAITHRTKAIIPVHLYGQPADMSSVLDLARQHGLKVVEDACQAHGAAQNGKKCGSFGDAAAFSFYPSKNLGAMGDGGAVTTNDDDIARAVRLLRNHGEDGDRLHVQMGYCSRLHGMQAAILGAKLPHLAEWNSQRARAASWYAEGLEGTVVARPTAAEGARHVYHLYVVRSADRDRLRQSLAGDGISTGIHYAVPLHLEPAYGSLGYREGDFPVAEQAARRIVSLPMYPSIESGEVEVVCRAIAAHERD